MARVEISTQGWGWVVLNGNPVSGALVQIKNTDGSNATHWSALTGGTSSTGTITTDSQGAIRRFIDPGTYDIEVNAVASGRVEAAAGTTQGVARFVRQAGAATNALIGSTQAWTFADAASNDAYGNVHIPHDCKTDATVTFEIFWTVTAGSGNVRWQVGSQNGFSHGEAVNVAATAYVGDFAAPTANVLERDTLAGPTVNPGDILQCTITRLGAHANDTLAASASLIGLNVLYDAVA